MPVTRSSMVQRMPAFVGGVTLVIGAALVASPGRVTGRLGLEGHDAAVRLVGASDLVLVPGLLRGSPRSPWMAGRAALNLVVAAYLRAAAPQSTAPELLQAGARVMLGLTAVDGATALALRRAES
jgi:hypothetical protein